MAGLTARPYSEADEKYKAALRKRGADADKTGEQWGRRWHASLSVGNAAGLAAMASAVLQITISGTESGRTIERFALLPAGWIFAIGLVAGALIPFIAFTAWSFTPPASDKKFVTSQKQLTKQTGAKHVSQTGNR